MPARPRRLVVARGEAGRTPARTRRTPRARGRRAAPSRRPRVEPLGQLVRRRGQLPRRAVAVSSGSSTRAVRRDGERGDDVAEPVADRRGDRAHAGRNSPSSTRVAARAGRVEPRPGPRRGRRPCARVTGSSGRSSTLSRHGSRYASSSLPAGDRMRRARGRAAAGASRRRRHADAGGARSGSSARRGARRCRSSRAGPARPPAPCRTSGARSASCAASATIRIVGV